MMRATVVSVALGIAAGCASHTAAPRILVNSPADESALRTLEEEFRKAKVANDPAALGRIVAMDYYGLNQNGNARNREQLLELFKNYPIRSLDVDIERVRISGDNAVTAGRQREGCAGKPACRNIDVFLRTYVRRDSRWQLLTSSQYLDPNKGGPANNTFANDVW
jgi:hypothetical protein